MRERIFSSVLLPAPLRPMKPITSPGCTSKETSRSAQKSLPLGVPGRPASVLDHAAKMMLDLFGEVAVTLPDD